MFNSRRLMFLAFLGIAGLFTGGCVSSSAYDRMENSYQDKIDALKAANQNLEGQNKDLQNRIANLKERIANLEAKLEIAKSGPSVDKFSDNPLIEIGEQGQLRLEGDLLFDPGSAEIKDSAKQALTDFAGQVGSNVSLKIVGHTDNEPIEASAPKWKTDTNMELGAHRALSIFLFLKKQGISPDNMYIASRGQYDPRKPNNSAENKSLNRRVEIWLYETGTGAPGASGSGASKGSSPSKGSSSEKGASPNKGSSSEKGSSPQKGK